MMLSAQERLALLLNLLGDKAVETAVSTMDNPSAQKLKSLVKDFEDEPPTEDEIAFVVDDFQRFFRLAIEKSAEPSQAENSDESNSAKQTNKSTPDFSIFDPSPDPREDLARLDPYQIARAVENEHPRTIALVVNEVADEQAAAIIDLLPDEIQGHVFGELRKDLTAPPNILNRILIATVQNGLKVEFVEHKREQPEKLAAILRSMPKATRVHVLESLAAEDEDFVKEIKALLYSFDDLKGLNKASMQKLLSEVATDVLTTALKDADEQIIQQIFDNVSKRARQTMEDEMQFQGNLAQVEIDAARKTIVETLTRLDESGDIEVGAE